MHARATLFGMGLRGIVALAFGTIACGPGLLDGIATAPRPTDTDAPVSASPPDAGPTGCSIAPFDGRFDPGLRAWGWDDETRYGPEDIAFADAVPGLDVAIARTLPENRGRYLVKTLSGGTCFELRVRMRVRAGPTTGGVFFVAVRFANGARFAVGMQPDRTLVLGQQESIGPGAPFTILGRTTIEEGPPHDLRFKFERDSVVAFLDGSAIPLEGRFVGFEGVTHFDLGVIYADANATSSYVIEEAKVF
jgi:hypothetical protein